MTYSHQINLEVSNGKERILQKKKEYFTKKKVENQLKLFRNGWKKNYRKAHKLGWDNWSFIKKLEFALRLIKQMEDGNSSHN